MKLCGGKTLTLVTVGNQDTAKNSSMHNVDNAAIVASDNGSVWLIFQSHIYLCFVFTIPLLILLTVE